jgi:hypothetical protein
MSALSKAADPNKEVNSTELAPSVDFPAPIHENKHRRKKQE